MEMRKEKVSHKRLQFHKASLAVFAVLAVVFTLISCTSVSTPPPAETSSASAYQEGVPGGIIVNTLDVSARVTAIDNANRKVTLLGPDGKTFTVKAGPEYVNFDQVDVGDWVNLTVTEELVVYLNEGGGSSSDESAALVALAPKGAQPGGLIAETTQITGTVTAIDPEKRTATLRFEDGSTKTFPVRSDVDLTNRKVGEQVVFRVTEMIAISVEKP
ncbi:MAG: copper-binding protein [Bacteroidales bacterium]